MKQNLAVLALLGVSSGHKHQHKQRFAEGLGDLEEHGQALRMKTKTLEQFNVAQLDSDIKDQ
jgi:hypothetical protein